MINNATAQSTVTATITISGGTGDMGDVQPPTTTRGANGSVNFENQNYNINVFSYGEINVTNKLTAEIYRIANDLRVDADGIRAFSFEGTTTFTLNDGTTITIDTEPKKEVTYGPLVASVLTIIDGLANYGVQISGLDGNETGALMFTEANKDEVTEWDVDTGNVVDENLAGSGFIAIDERGNIAAVDQQWIENTDQVKVWASELFNQYSGMVNFLSDISQITFLGTLPSSATYGNFNLQDHHIKPIKHAFRGQVKMEQPDDILIAAKRQPNEIVGAPVKEAKYKIHFVLARSLGT